MAQYGQRLFERHLQRTKRNIKFTWLYGPMQLGAQHEILWTCKTFLHWSPVTKISTDALPRPTWAKGNWIVLREGTPMWHFFSVINLRYTSFASANSFISEIYRWMYKTCAQPKPFLLSSSSSFPKMDVKSSCRPAQFSWWGHKLWRL